LLEMLQKVLVIVTHMAGGEKDPRKVLHRHLATEQNRRGKFSRESTEPGLIPEEGGDSETAYEI
jgi:hypothetical protein